MTAYPRFDSQEAPSDSETYGFLDNSMSDHTNGMQMSRWLLWHGDATQELVADFSGTMWQDPTAPVGPCNWTRYRHAAFIIPVLLPNLQHLAQLWQRLHDCGEGPVLSPEPH